MTTEASLTGTTYVSYQSGSPKYRIDAVGTAKYIANRKISTRGKANINDVEVSGCHLPSPPILPYSRLCPPILYQNAGLRAGSTQDFAGGLQVYQSRKQRG